MCLKICNLILNFELELLNDKNNDVKLKIYNDILKLSAVTQTYRELDRQNTS